MIGRHWKIVALAFFAAIAALSVFVGMKIALTSYGDFHWESARLLLEGLDPYKFQFDGRTYDGVSVDATQAPSTVIWLAPWGLLPRLLANKIWAFSNLVFTVMFFAFLRKSFRPFVGNYAYSLIICVVISGVSWRVLIANGQHLMFSLTFWIAAYWATRSDRKWLAGVLMAVGLMKYTATVPLAFIFLCRKEWLAIGVCAAIHIVLSALIGWHVGENPIVMIVESMRVAGGLTAAGDADIASVALSMGSACVKEWALVGYVFYGFLCFALCFIKGHDDLLRISVFAVLANVMFYHRVYDLVTLVFPLVLMVRDWDRKDWPTKIAMYATLVAVGWTFYVCGILGVLRLPHNRQLTGYIIENVLLVALLLRMRYEATAVCAKCGGSGRQGLQ